MAKKSAKEVVRESLPDLEVVEKPAAAKAAADSARRATTPGPSMADLRKKYLGADAEDEGVTGRGADSVPEDEEDVDVVRVRPKQRSADPADDPGPRTVIISKKKGPLGAQG
ncbi:MAG: hypothetical protein ACRC33_19075 [Gemmataceae bacterium]